MTKPIDRQQHILEQFDSAWPLPPLNISVLSSLKLGSYDIKWSHPSELSGNTKFSIVGVNVYRSYDSEFGPFYKLNSEPIGSTFYRDATVIKVALNENVSNNFVTIGDEDPTGKWTIVTNNKPIVMDYVGGSVSVESVVLTINGVRAKIESIMPNSGEIVIDSSDSFDVTSQTKIKAVVPKSVNDVILVSYKYICNKVDTSLDKKIFYRITTVAYDHINGSYIETPIDRATSSSNYQVEQIDWIWREAIRRNKFILTQGGERVKVMIRKTMGVRCGCYKPSHGQPSSNCEICYATGIIGGYVGPFDMMIAPDDHERKATQSTLGRTVDHSGDVWSGPSPLLSQRDFIVKQNSDRFAVGPVRVPSNRGMILQQHFNISSLDETDIRFKVPMYDTFEQNQMQTKWIKSYPSRSVPQFTERMSMPDEREIRGSTVVYENNNRK